MDIKLINFSNISTPDNSKGRVQKKKKTENIMNLALKEGGGLT